MHESHEPPTMLYRYVDRIFILVHTQQEPSDREWRAYCASLEQFHEDVRGVLVYTDGGGPSGKQRQQMRIALHGQPGGRGAILTNSAWARGIITALNWFLSNRLAAFEPHDIDGALHYLTPPGESLKRDDIVKVLSVLASQLSVRLPPARRASESQHHQL